jgi:hypothetical protein
MERDRKCFDIFGGEPPEGFGTTGMLVIHRSVPAILSGEMWNKIVRFLSANSQAGDPHVCLAEIKIPERFSVKFRKFLKLYADGPPVRLFGKAHRFIAAFISIADAPLLQAFHSIGFGPRRWLRRESLHLRR